MLSFNQAVITGGTFTQVNHTQEAGAHGFKLLQQSVADGAFHNSKERFDPPKCHEKTRTAVLQRILDWVFRQDEDTRDAFIMWLHGPAGAGKSAIMQTIAERLDANHRLVASFFFSRNHPTRGNADRLVATLVYQLALILPPQFRQDVVLVTEHDPLIFSKTLDVQFRELISGPMEQLLVSGWSTNHAYLLIIDGVDECDNPQIQSKIIDLAFRVYNTSPHLPFLFLIASRPELDICSSFESRKSISALSRLALDNKYLPLNDIRTYMLAEFDEIRTTHRFRSSTPQDWPSEEAVNTLVSKSSGQFIYVATVVKYVSSVRRRPTECLDKILGLRSVGKDTPFAELDSLYRHILSKVDDLETVLMAIGVALLRPLRFDGEVLKESHIKALLSLGDGDLPMLVQDLSCLVSVQPYNPTLLPYAEDAIHISHASLGDFLFDRSRSQDLWVNPKTVHNFCVNRCLTFLGDIATNATLDTELMLCRLVYHFPLADQDPVVVEKAHDYTFEVLQKHISRIRGQLGPDRLPWTYHGTLTNYYLRWAESMSLSNDQKVKQFGTEQLKAFDLYLKRHLDVYFSNPDLLWALLLLPVRCKSKAFPEAIFDKFDSGTLRLMLPSDRHSGGLMRLLEYDQYRSAVSVFLRDQERAGKYFITGATYSGVALHVLRHLCSPLSCPLPRSLSTFFGHKRRNCPSTWHRKQAKRGFDWRRYMPGRHSSSNWIYNNIRDPPLRRFLRRRRFKDLDDWGVYLLEEKKDIVAFEWFKNGLESLPYLLEKSQRLEELIDLAQTTRFGTMANLGSKSSKNYPYQEYELQTVSDDVRKAKMAVKEYLARMEGQV